MAQGVYTLKTLNDNWYEDRCQPPGCTTATGPVEEKVARPYETDLAYIGERYDVLARVARVPLRPSYATPEDGFNEKSKTSLTDFAHPRERPEYGRSKAVAPVMINTLNAPVRPPEMRELPGTQSGFGALISRHDANHDQRFWNTASGDFYGYRENYGTNRPPRKDPAEHRDAGVSTEHEEARPQGLRVGVMCGEAYNESANPASDTRTQRSWLYQPDASIRHIHLGGTRRSLPAQDSELSLPLGEGAMKKVREDLKARQGRLFRTATYITKGKGSRYGVSIFQDG
eukprot:TRINITY_DN96984_c0_g1_i1.p1 TRINITY_DN96984_c0_g1~~TRINITY_DN96984_c0_g1_i1.p1  ORF type:complete len:308 (-),score=30.83 TRINITY_DN96984_c0_g1_i1:184-1041(-)